jgi:hypothetical protein
VQELPLKGTREARGKPPRGGAWLKRPRASQRSGESPPGTGIPASRPGLLGQRPHPLVLQIPQDDRAWPGWHARRKAVRGTPEIPADRSGYREEREGSAVSHRLKGTGEGSGVNVGGPGGEGCCPPMKRMGVGGVIGLGARESCGRGAGRQGIDVVPGP